MGDIDLERLVEVGNVEEVEKYLNGGSDINRLIKGNYQMTLLHIACNYLQPAMILYLVENAADVNSRDSDSLTPLHCLILPSIQGGDYMKEIPIKLALIKYLIKNGANIEARDKQGNTPLHLAITCDSDSKLTKYLLQIGADTLAQNNKNQTPSILLNPGEYYLDDNGVYHEIIEYDYDEP